MDLIVSGGILSPEQSNLFIVKILESINRCEAHRANGEPVCGFCKDLPEDIFMEYPVGMDPLPSNITIDD